MGKTIAFCGTLKGMTELQIATVKKIIKDEAPTEYRHCDTTADVEIHEWILINNFTEHIVMYPPINDKIRGFSAATSKVSILPESQLTEGLRRMCFGADIMICVPHQDDNIGSGPAVAYEIAKKLNVGKIFTVMHNGTILQWPTDNIIKMANKIKKIGNIQWQERKKHSVT